MKDDPKIYPAGYTFTAKDLHPTGQYVENMIPSTGSVLLFGTSGVGKTTFACNMMNSIKGKQQFLGRNTNLTNCMFLSLDTPEELVKERWVRNKPLPFQQQFSFVPYGAFDCLHPQFQESPLWTKLGAYVREKKIGLVVVDSLRDVFDGEMNNDNNTQKVYSIFQEWFNRATVIFIHHTRKAPIMNGKIVEGNVDDEATGSKYWINKAQVSLYLKPVREQILKLQMGKSQCFKQWNYPILLEMDEMQVSEWDKAKTLQYTATYNNAEAWCKANVIDWAIMNKRERDEAMGQHLGCSGRWVRHMEAAAKGLVK